MQQIKELKDETTLSGIAQMPDEKNNHLLFAVIIDISEPYKTQVSTNYTTKIKLIDPSFNYKTKLDIERLKFHKFALVYIYSETPDNAPKIQNVGDIIRLRRFRFKIGQKNELVGFMQKYSNWLIYSGDQKSSIVSECFKNYQKNFNRELNEYEKGRLTDLRNWNNNFFFRNSLKYISWWTNCNQSSNNLQGVDLILKCYKIDYKKQKLFFFNQEQKEYEVTLLNQPNKLENKVIKLKHVNVEHIKNQPSIIKLTTFSSCLIIPKYFYDARKFEKVQQKQKPDKIVNKLIEKFEFLKNYNLENYEKLNNKILISAIKDSHNDKPFISLQELKKKLKNIDKIQYQKYRISVDIIALAKTNINDIVKVINVNDNSISNLEDIKDDKEDIQNKQILLNFVFIVKDESLDKNETQYLYLTSQDKNDQNLIQTWNIIKNKYDLKEWLNMSISAQKNLQQNLKKLSNPKYIAEFGIELVKTQSDKIFLKIIDTVFLPFN